MEEQILKKIEEQNEKIDSLTKTVNKIQKYFLITFWVTMAFFVLPLIAAIFIIPSLLNTYLSSFEGLI